MENKTSKQSYPVLFVYSNRYHEISDWKDLLHDLVEDIIFTGLDPECTKIVDKPMPKSGVPAAVSKRLPRSKRLSNGLFMPGSYTDDTYEKLCRDVSGVYEISPFDLRIFLEDDVAEIKDLYGSEAPAEPVVPQEKKEQREEKPAAEGKKPKKDSGKKTVVDSSRAIQDAVNNLFDKQPVVSGFRMTDAIAEAVERKISDIQAKAESGELFEDEDEDEDGDEDEKYDYALHSSWNSVITEFQEIIGDGYKARLAKQMQNAGLPVPTYTEYDLVSENGDVSDKTLAGVYGRRVLATATMVWKDQKIVYLTSHQRACAPVFRKFGYRTFCEDIKGLTEALLSDLE